MGFWNALSVLAPIAPAMSDAQDIRTQRTQDAAKFASDEQLKQAQLTAQKLAAQGEQQRITQGAQPTIIGEPQWNPTTHTNQVLTFDKNTGALALKDAPGVDPDKAAEDRLQAARKDFKDTTGRDLTPDEDQSLFFQAYGYKAPAASKFTPLAGAAGQPQPGPDGKSSVVYGRDETGNIVSRPLDGNYKPPAPKPQSPATQFVNLMAKQILANQGKGPKLTPEEAATLQATSAEIPMAQIAGAKARAVENARYGITTMTDDSGQEVDQTRLNIANMVDAGDTVAAGSQGHSTSMDKKTQNLALSAIDQVDRMQQILRTDPSLTGPGSGQLTRLQVLLGSQSPEAQQFITSGLLASEHGVAVFGGRNIHTIQDLQDTLGNMKTNPAALSAALDVVKDTMRRFANANGRLPGPRNPGAGGGPQKFKAGEFFMQGGHKFKATAVDKNGKVTAADPVG